MASLWGLGSQQSWGPRWELHRDGEEDGQLCALSQSFMLLKLPEKDLWGPKIGSQEKSTREKS